MSEWCLHVVDATALSSPVGGGEPREAGWRGLPSHGAHLRAPFLPNAQARQAPSTSLRLVPLPLRRRRTVAKSINLHMGVTDDFWVPRP